MHVACHTQWRANRRMTEMQRIGTVNVHATLTCRSDPIGSHVVRLKEVLGRMTSRRLKRRRLGVGRETLPGELRASKQRTSIVRYRKSTNGNFVLHGWE